MGAADHARAKLESCGKRYALSDAWRGLSIGSTRPDRQAISREDSPTPVRPHAPRKVSRSILPGRPRRNHRTTSFRCLYTSNAGAGRRTMSPRYSGAGRQMLLKIHRPMFAFRKALSRRWTLSPNVESERMGLCSTSNVLGWQENHATEPRDPYHEHIVASSIISLAATIARGDGTPS